MTSAFAHEPTRHAVLEAARERSPVEELRCHALLELTATAQQLASALRRELARSELTETSFRLLAQVWHGRAALVTPGQLARQIGLPSRDISSVLHRLEVSGLVARERDRDDRRRVGITLTRAGERIFSTALDRYVAAVTRLMSVLDSRDVESLDHACRILLQYSPSTQARSS